MSGPVFDIVISGERDVAARFERFPARVHERLLARITALTARMAEDERSRAPSRTGRLRSEIVDKIDETPDLVRGRVTLDAPGKEWAKAGALEYGAHKETKVRPSERGDAAVSAYERKPNIVEQRFARGALDDLRSEAKAALEEALRGA